MLSLGVVAGETSGDLLGAAVLQGLRALSNVDARGVVGPALMAENVTRWNHIDELSVRGYVEVLRHLPRLMRLRSHLVDEFLKWKPQFLIGIDAPDFNIELERRVKVGGVKTIHFIGPSVWAWRYERIAKVRAAAHHVLLVFPFEKAIYDKEGIAATYVGHPLADVIPLSDSAIPSEPQKSLIVALMPGSRTDEVKYMGRSFLQTAAWLCQQRADLHFVLPAANQALKVLLQSQLSRDQSLANALAGRLTITDGQSHSAIKAAAVCLVASGTATLEVALFKKPMVIAYKMPSLSYRLMKGKGYLPYIGLPNILANEFLVPEFIQDAATPQFMGQALLKQLDDAPLRARLYERFMQMHIELKQDCAARAADTILELAER